MTGRALRWPRSGRGLTGLAFVGLLLAAVLTTWLIGTSRAASGVEVRLGYGGGCDGGAKLTAPKVMEGETVLRLRRGSHCVVTVQVTNAGQRAVRLESLVAPLLGRDWGGIVVADPMPPDSLRLSGSDWVDAAYVVDEVLEPGASVIHEIRIGFRDSGCSQAYTSYRGWPVAVVSRWGRTLEVPGEDQFTFRQLGRSPGCRDG